MVVPLKDDLQVYALNKHVTFSNYKWLILAYHISDMTIVSFLIYSHWYSLHEIEIE